MIYAPNKFLLQKLKDVMRWARNEDTLSTGIVGFHSTERGSIQNWQPTNWKSANKHFHYSYVGETVCATRKTETKPNQTKRTIENILTDADGTISLGYVF